MSVLRATPCELTRLRTLDNGQTTITYLLELGQGIIASQIEDENCIITTLIAPNARVVITNTC